MLKKEKLYRFFFYFVERVFVFCRFDLGPYMGTTCCNRAIVGFHSRDQQPCFLTKTKENVCIIIELNSHRIWSGLFA